MVRDILGTLWQAGVLAAILTISNTMELAIIAQIPTVSHAMLMTFASLVQVSIVSTLVAVCPAQFLIVSTAPSPKTATPATLCTHSILMGLGLIITAFPATSPTVRTAPMLTSAIHVDLASNLKQEPATAVDWLSVISVWVVWWRG